MKKIQESEVNVKKHQTWFFVKGRNCFLLTEKQSGNPKAHNTTQQSMGSPFRPGLDDFYNYSKIRLNSNFSPI